MSSERLWMVQTTRAQRHQRTAHSVSRRQLSDDIVEWDPGFELPPLPEMCQIVRHRKEPIPPIADALVAELLVELSSPVTV